MDICLITLILLSVHLETRLTETVHFLDEPKLLWSLFGCFLTLSHEQ